MVASGSGEGFDGEGGGGQGVGEGVGEEGSGGNGGGGAWRRDAAAWLLNDRPPNVVTATGASTTRSQATCNSGKHRVDRHRQPVWCAAGRRCGVG